MLVHVRPNCGDWRIGVRTADGNRADAVPHQAIVLVNGLIRDARCRPTVAKTEATGRGSLDDS